MSLEKTVLNEYRRGDAHPGLTFGPVIIDGVAPIANAVSAKMQFRDEDDALGFELNDSPAAGEGTIVLTDVATWEFTVSKQIFDLGITNGEDTQKYYWDIEIIDTNGHPLTIAYGTMVVRKDITHD